MQCPVSERLRSEKFCTKIYITNKLQHCHITFLWQICLQKYGKGMNKLMQKEDLVDNGKWETYMYMPVLACQQTTPVAFYREPAADPPSEVATELQSAAELCSWHASCSFPAGSSAAGARRCLASSSSPLWWSWTYHLHSNLTARCRLHNNCKQATTDHSTKYKWLRIPRRLQYSVIQ